MTVKVTTRGATELRDCKDCGSSHIGPACGMTFAQRMKSVRLDSDWMPSRTAARQSWQVHDDGIARPEKEYYDDQALTEMFGDGLTGEERKEELMEETKGVGYATPKDLKERPELVFEHYLNSDD